jgi:hypothetical protein
MKTWGVTCKSCAPVAILLTAFLVSCNSLFTQSNDQGNEAGANAGLTTSGNGFTTAPVSPGGTGGSSQPQQDDVDLPGEQSGSFFKAFQVDPPFEHSAGPKFVVAADIDQDGLLDVVSAWNQSQPIQIHLQRRDSNNNIFFRTITIAGTSPTAVMAGLAVGQVDGDGWLDIVVLVKAAGGQTICPPDEELSLLEGEIIVYFSPGDAQALTNGDLWDEMILINPFVADPWIHNQFPGHEAASFVESQTKPELSGFASLAMADLDDDGFDDIIVALNPAACEGLGQEPPINTVDLWMNPGGVSSRTSALWGSPPVGDQSRNVPISIMASGSQVKDIAIMDVDGDGDLDVIATFTTAITQNVSWARNPFIAHNVGGPSGRVEMERGVDDSWRFWPLGWQVRPIGQIDSGADVLSIGDVDGDGFDDVIVRSTGGGIVQWFRRPNDLVVMPEFPPGGVTPDRFNFPWPVFTLTELPNQEPQAIAIGDITGDGRNEVIVAAGGGVSWFDGTQDLVFNPWFPNKIIQDSPAALANGSGAPAPGSGVGVEEVDTSTYINALLVVDLDGDGRNDIVGTLDRRSGSGLTDDRLVWYRNIKTTE